MDLELKNFSLLADLDDEDRTEIADRLETAMIARDQALFEEGDEASALFFVAFGCFRGESRRSGILGALGAGNWVGASSLVSLGARELTLIATEDSRVLRLDRSSFQELAYQAPGTACKLLEAIVRDLADSVRLLLDRFDDR